MTDSDTDIVVERILTTYDTIVVVGASGDPSKAANAVPAHMQRHGWHIVPVNPRAGEILGERAFATLAEVPGPIGLVDVFRPPAETPAVAQQAVAAGATALWLQLGITSGEARRIAEEAGLLYVEDRCLVIEQRRLGLDAPSLTPASVGGLAIQHEQSFSGKNQAVHIPAKVDYGIRALLALTAAGEDSPQTQTTESLAAEQGLPPRFLGAILADLRRSGIVVSQRGAEGGYRLGRRPEKITLADVIRALDGPLAEVRGFRPEAAHYDGAAAHLQDVWVAVRASLRAVLENVTLAEVAQGKLPKQVLRLIADPDAWQPH